MATTTADDITILEFKRLEDIIDADLDAGKDTFETAALAARADVTTAKVDEAMQHLCEKYDYITVVGKGEWHFDVPGEDDGDEA